MAGPGTMSANGRGLQYGLVVVDGKAVDAEFMASDLFISSLEDYIGEHMLDTMT